LLVYPFLLFFAITLLNTGTAFVTQYLKDIMPLMNPELLEVALRPLLEKIIDEKLEPHFAELNSLQSISAKNEKPIPVKEMSLILGISVSHLYKKCNNNEMPHHRKFGRLYFYLSDIKKWMND